MQGVREVQHVGINDGTEEQDLGKRKEMVEGEQSDLEIVDHNTASVSSSLGRRQSAGANSLFDVDSDVRGLEDLENTHSYDQASTREFARIDKTIERLQRDIGKLETLVDAATAGDNVIVRLKPTLKDHKTNLENNTKEIEILRVQIEELKTLIGRYAAEAKVKHANIQKDIKTHEKALLAANEAKAAAETELAEAAGQMAVGEATLKKNAQQTIIFDSARAILRLRVQENRGVELSPVLEKQIADIQMQLRETILEQYEAAANPAAPLPLRDADREKAATTPGAPTSLPNPWADMDDVQKARNTQALRSVEKLASNPAFKGLEKAKKIEDLRINQKLLDLMNLASFALFHFNKAAEPEVPGSANRDTQSSRVSESKSTTPQRSLSRNDSTSVSTPASNKVSDRAAVINAAVIDVIRDDLIKIQTEAGGLIGSPNPERQYWGKVLMVLALAIAAIVAAVTIMSILGVASPAFIVPYLAAIQSSSMVSTVLNFVAAKLTVDLNTAAVVTAVATAGALGLFGKTLHASGAPTQLKRDLDKAAQDMEAALSQTSVVRTGPQ